MDRQLHVNGDEDIYKEVLTGLKHCHEMVPGSVSPGIIQKCLDLLVSRLACSTESGPWPTSSTDSSRVRSSIESKITDVIRSTWWFEDLVTFLTPDSIKILVNSMILQRFDHAVITKLITHYQKSRFIVANSDERREIIEAIIGSLCLLDQNSVSYKILFDILRVSMNLNMKMSCKNSLECMIGSRLDLATLDDILVPSPNGSSYLYDVNLVLRLVKFFLIGKEGCEIPISRLKKVATLIDSYIAEVAPDPCLKPSKFLALIKSIPTSARDSYDELYHAIDIYLQVHTELSANEKFSICCNLDYNKLSSEASNHLSQNRGFPSRFVVLAPETPQINPESLHCVVKGFIPLISRLSEPIDDHNEKGCEEVALCAEKQDLVTENEKIRTQLQGMQCRVVELEKDCTKLQVQMSKIMKSKLCSKSHIKSLPRLCSG